MSELIATRLAGTQLLVEVNRKLN